MRGLSDCPEEGERVVPVSSVRRGTTTAICGCMFSGKTTELLTRLAVVSPDSVLVIKHEIDRRYRKDAVVSHDGRSWPAVEVSSSGQIADHVQPGIELVAVDEAHFFSEELIDVLQALVSQGVSVIVTSLDRDSWGKPFPIAEGLLSVADEPIVKRAVCARCGRAANRTQRLTPILDGNMVGGSESYEPRCAKCWRRPPEPRLA
jgi:thymidine kinase